MPGLLAKRMARAGRYGDDEVVHATTGETVVPQSVMAQPGVRRGLMRGFRRAGLEPGRHEIGGRDDSRNPVTGLREFYDPGGMSPGAMGGAVGGSQDGGGMSPGGMGGVADSHSGPSSTGPSSSSPGGPGDDGFDIGKHNTNVRGVDALSGGIGPMSNPPSTLTPEEKAAATKNLGRMSAIEHDNKMTETFLGLMLPGPLALARKGAMALTGTTPQTTATFSDVFSGTVPVGTQNMTAMSLGPQAVPDVEDAMSDHFADRMDAHNAIMDRLGPGYDIGDDRAHLKYLKNNGLDPNGKIEPRRLYSATPGTPEEPLYMKYMRSPTAEAA